MCVKNSKMEKENECFTYCEKMDPEKDFIFSHILKGI